MKNLIATTIITTEVIIAEDDLRARLEELVLEGLGYLNDKGLPRPGISVRTFSSERSMGGYRVQVRRDITQDLTPRLELKGVQP